MTELAVLGATLSVEGDGNSLLLRFSGSDLSLYVLRDGLFAGAFP